ncbi:YifB family Mg chelatase-like AAA ATPase [Alicyclobacillus tolerans]|uniref:YifB family Mg chelatase-like AAA ATPase n=1 Tax=Alicyclobacillus tolerans TaxID=90970 RepID=UPI001F012A5C|nr:YifB family Mg chelatase-like AAA ATPase [Alicyclobacillus tolerans]MCF8564738.1 YifB family Mg chelatase-like AAA ATPase [Alicyclobacillus tolerans]
MVGTSLGAVLDGLEATVVKVEADVSNGLPQFAIVGLPDSAVSESKLRIRSAIKNSGLEFPSRRITVNLSPASMRKHGAGLDLAIAIAILRAIGTIPEAVPEALGFCAELNLSGNLVPVGGFVNLALAFRREHISSIVLSMQQHPQFIPIPDLHWHPFSSLKSVVHFLSGKGIDELASPGEEQVPLAAFFEEEAAGDFADVVGLPGVKRALTIAAAGKHHALLVGPPGCGKTMIAERFPGILPHLTPLAALEVYALHQAAGIQRVPSRTPPLRIPHHTLTRAGLIGGGAPPMAGEASLAHHGVLILDELLEFPRQTLDSLREPLVQQKIRLTRAGHSVVLPADFILVATMNPCPCGQRGFGECRCTDSAVQRYWSHLSGPLLDRVDIAVSVRPEDLAQTESTIQTSEQIRTRVEHARKELEARRLAAFTRQPAPQGRVAPLSFEDYEDAAEHLLRRAGKGLKLSRRGIASVHRVARTIAVLDESDVVSTAHVEEALALRGTIATP